MYNIDPKLCGNSVVTTKKEEYRFAGKGPNKNSSLPTFKETRMRKDMMLILKSINEFEDVDTEYFLVDINNATRCLRNSACEE